MTLMDRHPSIADLRRLAKRRMPNVGWEYLDSGTAAEEALPRNREAMRAVTLTPRFLRDAREPDTSMTLFGVPHTAPFGVAPIGLQSLMWPGAEVALAKMAKAAGIPYALSTMAGESIERIAEVTQGDFWFQLYALARDDIRHGLIDRAQKAGAKALVVTVDVPMSSRRERQRRAGVAMPPKIGPKLLADVLGRPTWLRETLRRGTPRLLNLTPYAKPGEFEQIPAFSGMTPGYTVSAEMLREIRDQWDGPLILKGIMHPDDALEAVEAGVDGIWVSNHGGRQLDIAPASIEALPRVVRALEGRAPILFDSGVRSGGDIARAVALGADCVFLGRAFTWGVAALGEPGAAHAEAILREELRSVMTQLGCSTLGELKERLSTH